MRRACTGGKSKPPGPTHILTMNRDTAGAEESSTMAVDPVCGMRVERALATGTEEFRGRLYFFCSASCKQTFRVNPGHYALTPVGQEASAADARRTPPGSGRH